MCFGAASQMWSSNCLPIVSLSLEFETVTAVGLQSWVNCPTLWISLVIISYLFPVSFHLYPALANGFRISACLSSLPLLSPSLAFDG